MHGVMSIFTFCLISLQYPHLVHAAVASSAPVRAQVNFEGYNEVVAASFGNSMVGGSKQVRQLSKFAITQQSTQSGGSYVLHYRISVLKKYIHSLISNRSRPKCKEQQICTYIVSTNQFESLLISIHHKCCWSAGIEQHLHCSDHFRKDQDLQLVTEIFKNQRSELLQLKTISGF